MKVDCQRLHDSGSFRPSNPHRMQIWRFWKQVQKNLEIGTSNLEISKVCLKLKEKQQITCLSLFSLFSAPCCILLLLFSLSSSGQRVAILKFVHVFEGLAFPETLAHRCFTGSDLVSRFSHKSVWLIRLLCTQIIRYSFILCRSFRHFQGFLAHRKI